MTDRLELRLEGWLKNLDQNQRKAAESSPYEPLLICAGAGSGKTRVIMTRIAWLIERIRVDPANILALSFTKKACEEMSDRIAKVCRIGTSRTTFLPFHFIANIVISVTGGIAIKTFHAFALAICKEQYRYLGFSQQPRLLEASEKVELLKQALLASDPQILHREYPIAEDWEGAGHENDFMRDDGPITAAIAYYSRIISTSKRMGHGPSRHVGTDRAVFEDFEKRKKILNTFDQDDSIPLVVFLLKTFPDIVAYYRSQYRHILIDEFQDVSRIQMELIKLLIPNESDVSSDHQGRCITACGDKDQSIYGFLNSREKHLMVSGREGHGGNSNFDEFLAYWCGANIVKLQRNYRSTGNLVRAAGALIAKNGANETSCVCETANSDGQKVILINSSSEEREVQAVCDAIEKIRARGTLYQHICILYRARNIAKPFQRELARRKIPTNNTAPDLKGGPYRKAIAQDLIAYLRVAVNANDPEAFKRSINRPNRGLGIKTVEKLIAASKRWGTTLWIAAERIAKAGGADISTAQRSGLGEYVRIIKCLKSECATKSPEEVLRSIYTIVFQGSTKSKATVKDEEDSSDIQAMLGEMVEDLEIFGCSVIDSSSTAKASSVDSRTARALSRFASIVSQSSSDIRKERGTEVVTLTTVHQAKGLEFQIVFLVRFNETIFPIQLKPTDGEDEDSYETRRAESIQEERRLAYVALSRARVSLYISWILGGQDGLIHSRFIDELPKECLQSQKDSEIAGGLENCDQERNPNFQHQSPENFRMVNSSESAPYPEAESEPWFTEHLIQSVTDTNIDEAHRVLRAIEKSRCVDGCVAKTWERCSFQNRQGWDPALPSTAELLPGAKNILNASPKQDIYHRKYFSKQIMEFDSAAESGTDGILSRPPVILAAARERNVHHILSHSSLQGDAVGNYEHVPTPNSMHAHKSIDRTYRRHENIFQGSVVRDMHIPAVGHQESDFFWKDRVRCGVMDSLPNFLTSNVGQEDNSRVSESYEEISPPHKILDCVPASCSVRHPLSMVELPIPTKKSSSTGYVEQKHRKTSIPSFLLDPEDMSEDDAPFEKAGKLPKRTDHNFHRVGSPLNFSWGRDRKPSLLSRRK